MEQPKPYGIDNTYQYLRHMHTQIQPQPQSMPQPSVKRRVLQRLTLPGLAKKEPNSLECIAQSNERRNSRREQDGLVELEKSKVKAEEIVHLQYFRG